MRLHRRLLLRQHLQEASKESKRTIAVFNEEDELKLAEFFKDD